MTDPFENRTVDTTARLSPEDGRVAAVAVDVHRHTPEHPPAVKLLVSNLTGVPRQFAFGTTPPFTRRTLAHSDGDVPAEPDGDAALVVVPGAGTFGPHGTSYVERYVPDEPRDGCWRASEVPHRKDGGTLRILDAGAGVFRTYSLLDHPDNATCLPEGRYVGTQSFQVGESRPEEQSGHPELEYEIELVVDVR